MDENSFLSNILSQWSRTRVRVKKSSNWISARFCWLYEAINKNVRKSISILMIQLVWFTSRGRKVLKAIMSVFARLIERKDVYQQSMLFSSSILCIWLKSHTRKTIEHLEYFSCSLKTVINDFFSYHFVWHRWIWVQLTKSFQCFCISLSHHLTVKRLYWSECNAIITWRLYLGRTACMRANQHVA